MKPIIGVMPLWDDERQSIWMLPGYMDGIREAGAIPVILPLSAQENDVIQVAGVCSGFLFTGGHDVSPEIYHEEPLEGLVECCPPRDAIERIVLSYALKTGKPVLGICRGIQFINAALGGSLYQDLPTQHPSDTQHHQDAPYDVPTHAVTVRKDTPLYDLLCTEQLPVNSCHHQAVKEIAPGLKAMAVSPDGLVEALYMPDHPFVWAVQWHPEFSYQKDDASRKIFEAFADEAGRWKNRMISKDA